MKNKKCDNCGNELIFGLNSYLPCECEKEDKKPKEKKEPCSGCQGCKGNCHPKDTGNPCSTIRCVTDFDLSSRIQRFMFALLQRGLDPQKVVKYSIWYHESIKNGDI